MTILSVQPTAPLSTYTNPHQVLNDYRSGKPVLVRGYDRLSGLTIDCYEEPTLRDMGYTHVEFRLGAQSLEVAL
jgi:hypothetical protein